MNGKLVEEDIKAWIKHEGLKLYDLYLFGLEEMVPLTVPSVVFNYNVEKQMNRWIETIVGILKSIHGIVPSFSYIS